MELQNSKNNPIQSGDIRDTYDEKYFEGISFLHISDGSLDVRMFSEKYKALHAVSMKSDDVVLDLGCGQGDLVFHLAHRSRRILGVDYSYPALQMALKIKQASPAEIGAAMQFVCADANTLPMADETVDKVFFLDVIEHLSYQEQEKVLWEIHRVLRPCGEVVLLTPLSGLPPLPVQWYRRLFKPEKWRLTKENVYKDARESRHIGLLSRKDMHRLLHRCGFHTQIRVVTSEWQDSSTDYSAIKKWLFYKLLLPLFGTKMLAVGRK